jgi:inositol transport system substrate-binding protein
MAGGYAIEQIHQIFRFIHVPEAQRPAAIVTEPVSEDGMPRLARNAARAGIGWVTLNHHSPWLAELRAEFPNLPFASVSTDQVEAGRIQGRQACALLPHGGRALCILGPSEHEAAAERRQGMEEVVSSSGIAVTFVEGQWTRESGVRLMRNWTRLRIGSDLGLDLLVCQNDDMAAGARSVLLAHAEEPQRAHWRDLPCLGMDGLASGGQAMVDRGELAATVVNPSNTGPAVALLARWLRAGEALPAEVRLPPSPYPDHADLLLAPTPMPALHHTA